MARDLNDPDNPWGEAWRVFDVPPPKEYARELARDAREWVRSLTPEELKAIEANLRRMQRGR